MKSKNRVATPAGTLASFSRDANRMTSATHLNKNIHLHVEFSLTPPPMSGPARLPRATAAPICAAIPGYWFGDAIS